ncbi:MAG TPA: hypothetical protein VK509_06890 [Polyangiales bacterium]|nr:hypothetical protein [Polyangiales bacterium]
MRGGSAMWTGCAVIAAWAAIGCAEHRVLPSEEQDDGTGMNDSPGSTKPRLNTGNTTGAGNVDDGPADQPDREQPERDTPKPSAATDSCAVPVKTDKLDLLFMVDNSGSMAQEQSALREQFPKLISVLTSGNWGDDRPSFPPINDLHLAVVSSDLGLVGISDIDKCQGLGDDGVMQNEPRLAGCASAYPRFLTYTAGLNSYQDVANDFACIAMLGTDGCGFEQPLETTLKSLWPGADDRIKFLGDSNNFGNLGHGDSENQGFLRSDPENGLSVVAVVLVTDEDDCSSQNTEHFTPNAYLDPNIPEEAKLLQQGLNVRCNFNQPNLYATERYVNGLKALRPGHENMVLFAAIVGVPPETVDANAVAGLDLGEFSQREEFYDNIMNHPDMQPVVDGRNTPDPQDDTMRPSCNTSSGLAYPPRRIVEVARGFGANGMVQSICQEDFGPAVDTIVRSIGQRLANADCVL